MRARRSVFLGSGAGVYTPEARYQLAQVVAQQDMPALRGHVRDASGMRRDLLLLSNDPSHAWVAMEALVANIPPEV